MTERSMDRVGWEKAIAGWLPDGGGIGGALEEAVSGAYAGMRRGGVAPRRGALETRAAVRSIPLDDPLGLSEAVREAVDLMEQGDLRSASARCFGYFNPTPAWPAVVADALVGARNPQLCVSSHAPASVEMERHLIDWLIERIGWAEGTGHFTSGGSEANATSLMVALNRIEPRFATEGVRSLGPRPVFYASADSHLAWVKIARSVGLGSDALVLAECDAQGRIDAEKLAARVMDDAARGARPIMLVATMGTTNGGELDPVPACRAIADAHGMHLHVDAAWAGGLLVDETRRALLAGIELGDSVTIDAHKWLNATMGAGMLFVRDVDAVARTFGVTTGYMPVGDGADAYLMSNQWSRRFLGMRLWLTLRAGGTETYRAFFDRQFALADRFRTLAATRGWRVCNRSTLPVVLFDDGDDGVSADALADGVAARGRVWLGCVMYGGKRRLRFCVTSFLTGPDEIDVLLDELEAVRRQAWVEQD